MKEILAFTGIWVVLTVAMLVHELGHALVAGALGEKVEEISLGLPRLFTFKLFGIPVRVGLLPLIGGTKLDSLLKMRWLKKAVIALSGPVFNFAFALCCYYAVGGFDQIASLAEDQFLVIPTVKSFFGNESLPTPGLTALFASMTPKNVIFAIGDINLLLAILNMLPIPVLDGGRILFAFLEGVFGKVVNNIQAILIPISFILLILWQVLIK
ncbi:MAG: site-2 protease family protein [Candidatus Woesebacteria bacterium]|nr:MAG: site-2 protease family protein [Candidatus Woesebacteria bacterium]